MTPKRLLSLLLAAALLLACATARAQGDPAGTTVPTPVKPVPEFPAQAPQEGQPALGPESSYDLSAAVRRGLAVNPRIWSARYQLLGAEAARLAARGAFGFTTTVNYNYTHLDEEIASGSRVVSPQDTFALNLNLTQPLFTGFRLLNSYQRAALSKEQAESQIANAELTLQLDIQTNFLGLLKARDNVRSAADAVARLQAQLNTTSAFFDVGLRPRLDVLQAETDLATAEQDLVVAEDSVSTQIARLNTLLNLPLENQTNYVGELEYLPFSLSVPEGLKTAYRSRPDLIIAQRSIEIAEKDAGIAKSGLYPQVSANFNYNREGEDPLVRGYGENGPGKYSDWNTGVAVRWQAFDWGQTWYNYKSATENISRVASEYQNLRLEVTNAVKASHLQIQDASKRISVTRKAIEAAREGYRMAVARYQAQVGTNTDVLDAQARLTRAEADQTLALADYQIALARFYAAIGVKNSTLTPQ